MSRSHPNQEAVNALLSSVVKQPVNWTMLFPPYPVMPLRRMCENEYVNTAAALIELFGGRWMSYN